MTRLSADADGRDHLECVRPRIVTEYLLRVFDRERPVDGLVFASAAGRDGPCTVLDTLQTHCLDPGDPEPDEHTALRLVPGTLHADQPLSFAPHSG
ncbi:hypothetical protein [Streptomyces hirsutus]|uniref:hypothetical protein n=1 Tax=Streptomyces hirsutus TaxID=35620 RepID=UPI00146FD4FF|nr:hypothetical protein [Streptomyces hirsutus]